METTMKTKTNVSKKDTILGVYESFGRGDIPAILDTLTDDIIWDSSQNPVLAEAKKIYNGKKAVTEFFQLVGKEMDFQVFDPQNFFERGNVLFVNGRFEYTLKDDNSKWSTDWTMRFQFRGDKVERFNEYFETPQSL